MKIYGLLIVFLLVTVPEVLDILGTAAAEQSKVTVTESTKKSLPENNAQKFGGIKADNLIYSPFGANAALWMGRIAIDINSGSTQPAGPMTVVVFRNLNQADTLLAKKVGGKPNAAYMITPTGKLKYLGDIEKSLEDEAVFKLFDMPKGGNGVFSWEEFVQFLKQKR